MMKRYAILTVCAALACLALGANLGFAQPGVLAPVADPQRPDEAPAETRRIPSTPGAALPREDAILYDPQRPDEHAPAKPVQRDLNLPQVIELTLTPAAEPVPALKYELLPASLARISGNGATNYYRAMLHSQQVLSSAPPELRESFGRHSQEWIDKPLKELSPSERAEMEKWVGYYRNALWEVKLAAYREECHFDLRLQDLRGMDTVNFLLHDFQESRSLARALRLRGRLEVANGKLDEALETARQGMQLARDTAEPELLINGLIGIAIASMMQEELIEIIDQPGSPNLYWAIASLPRPLVNVRRGMRFEMDMPERMFPFLKDAETAQRTPEEWQKLLVESVNSISEVVGTNPRPPEWQSRLTATAGLMLVYPDCKKRLIEDGFDRELLEKMPAAQVVAIQASRAQKKVYHNVFKWTSLPYSLQSTRAADALQEMIAEMGGPTQMTAADPLFLARLLLPAVQQAMTAEVRTQANFAALQTIEALRMHAAGNRGKLPKTLHEVTIVPVPMNPATDQPFAYELKDGIATLTVPVFARQPAALGKIFVIRLEAK